MSPVVTTIMKHELETEAWQLAESIAEMEIAIARSSELDMSHSARIDWSNTYKIWEKYQDTDELLTRMESAKGRLAKVKERMNRLDGGNSKNCSHRFACGCSGNKSAERKVVAMSTSGRLKEMHSFKDEGNIFFGEKRYGEALARYEKALIYFEYCFDGVHDEKMQANNLRLRCLLNAGERCGDVSYHYCLLSIVVTLSQIIIVVAQLLASFI